MKTLNHKKNQVVNHLLTDLTSTIRFLISYR
jgi:hypothetical protein